MLDKSFYDKADEIIASYGTEPKWLIPIIQDVQTEYRYLPPELLTYIAGKLNITEAKAYSVATFYENFSFEQKGKYVIKVCDGTACHVRKSTTILDQLYKELKKPEVRSHYKAIVVDTVDVAADKCKKYICQQNDIEEILKEVKSKKIDVK